eukprot:1282992-Prymnesium_polylepis.2
MGRRPSRTSRGGGQSGQRGRRSPARSGVTPPRGGVTLELAPPFLGVTPGLGSAKPTSICSRDSR